MARPTERCRGEVTTAGLGRQIGDRCKKHGAASQNYLCHLHVRQHNNPNYPTENSYRLRPGERPDHTPSTEVQSNTSQARPSNRERPVDNPLITTANVEPSASSSRLDERLHRTSQTEVQGNTSQAGPSTRQRPVDNPSRTTANDQSWPSTAPQRRPASFRPQLSTIFEPSPLDYPQREPASSRSQLSTPPEQPDRRRHATAEQTPLHDRTPTQASNTVIKPIRRLLSQHTPTPQGVSRESNQIRFPRPSSLPPTPTSGAVNGILPQSRREQSSISQPSPSSADSNNEQNETESQPQRTHRHNSSNTSEQSSIAGSSSTNSTPRSSPPPLIPQARSILRQRSRLVRNLSYALIDAGQITSNDSLRAVFSEQTSVPGASSILDIIVDMLQGYMELRDIDEIPKGLAAKLLRAACDQGEEGERSAEQLRQWVRRGGTVDDDVVEAFGLDDFEEWMRVGEGWMKRTWGFLSSMMDLRKEKRD